MNTCIKCGKSGETLWLSKSGYCEECAESVLKAQAQAEIRAQQQEQLQAQRFAQQQRQMPSSSQQVNPHPNMFNMWFVGCIVCVIIGFVCLLAISFDGGFRYVGGDAYNMQITANLASNWFILALIAAVVGSAQYIGECLRLHKNP